jgi:hypothetical protein
VKKNGVRATTATRAARLSRAKGKPYGAIAQGLQKLYGAGHLVTATFEQWPIWPGQKNLSWGYFWGRFLHPKLQNKVKQFCSKRYTLDRPVPMTLVQQKDG